MVGWADFVSEKQGSHPASEPSQPPLAAPAGPLQLLAGVSTATSCSRQPQGHQATSFSRQACHRLFNPLTTQPPPSPTPQLCRFSAPGGSPRPARGHRQASTGPAPGPPPVHISPAPSPPASHRKNARGHGGAAALALKGSPSHDTSQKRESLAELMPGGVRGVMSCVQQVIKKRQESKGFVGAWGWTGGRGKTNFQGVS